MVPGLMYFRMIGRSVSWDLSVTSCRKHNFELGSMPPKSHFSGITRPLWFFLFATRVSSICTTSPSPPNSRGFCSIWLLHTSLRYAYYWITACSAISSRRVVVLTGTSWDHKKVSITKFSSEIFWPSRKLFFLIVCFCPLCVGQRQVVASSRLTSVILMLQPVTPQIGPWLAKIFRSRRKSLAEK